MIVIKNENVRPFDIDDTLIYEYNPETNPKGTAAKTVSIKDPLTGGMIVMCVHESMVRLLKEEYHRGSHIIVWSRGGYEWAAAVITALNLQQYVNEVYSKPMVYFDDKDVSEWMPSRVYLPPNSRYKK